MPGFFFFALVSARQARRARGNLGTDLLAKAKRTFWTCTAWEDEASMREFMIPPPHRRAMPKLLEWCDEAASSIGSRRAPSSRIGKRHIDEWSRRDAGRRFGIPPLRMKRSKSHRRHNEGGRKTCR